MVLHFNRHTSTFIWVYNAYSSTRLLGLQKMCIVMELCELGDLKTLLFRGSGPFSEVSCRFIVKQLSEAIVYLHKNGRFLQSGVIIIMMIINSGVGRNFET